jgi:hypothetical protein
VAWIDRQRPVKIVDGIVEIAQRAQRDAAADPGVGEIRTQRQGLVVGVDRFGQTILLA